MSIGISDLFLINFLQNLNKSNKSFSFLVIDKIIELITVSPYIFFHSGIRLTRFVNSEYCFLKFSLNLNTSAFSLISISTP